ncbi:hypothetical protein LTR87_005735 [Friedmanniomyces endolithicus]|nr:hypothetical protein LTR87_005735 [Friedmanniomyces endolithicus]
MSQPHEYSNSGRLRKKTVFFDDLQAEHQQKATAIKEERQVSGLGRMQNTQADNDLVSPNTPTPAPRISTASQHLPIPAATNSAPISPTTVPPIEVASKDTAAAPTRRIAETPVGGPSSGSKAMSSKPRLSPKSNDCGRIPCEAEPPQIVYTRGRERPTGYGADWYGVVQPLFRGETHPPDGVQRHISMEEGETGSWDIDSGPEDDDELWASHRHFGEFVHGTSIDDGHRLTALEQAAGVGEDPMDAMMTSDEEV